jgi:ribose transport system permease protein
MSLQRLWSLLGPFLGVLVVGGLFSLLAPDSFPTVYNFRTVATQTVIVGLGAIGMTFVIIAGGIDLSVGSVISLSSVVTALCLKNGMSPVTAIVLGVATGAVCGLANGVLITGLRVVPFIVTLGVLGIASGLAKWFAGQQKVDAPASWLPELVQKTPEPAWLLVSPAVWFLVLMAILVAVVLRRSVFGVHVYAIGGNETAARVCGVPVERTKVLVYALCGAFTGMAGVMQFARLTVGDPTVGIGLELHIIAAVVIGGGSLAGGEGSILGSLIGAFIMSFLRNGCTLTGVPNYVQEILVGAIIITAVVIDRLRHR